MVHHLDLVNKGYSQLNALFTFLIFGNRKYHSIFVYYRVDILSTTYLRLIKEPHAEITIFNGAIITRDTQVNGIKLLLGEVAPEMTFVIYTKAELKNSIECAHGVDARRYHFERLP